MIKMTSLKKTRFWSKNLSLFFIFQVPEKEQRIVDPREKHVFQNQSIRFSTHKKLNYHQQLMRKGAGVGRDGEDFFIRKITQTGGKKFLFEINTIDIYSKKCQNIKIEITELQYKRLDVLMDQIFCIMSFQIGIQKYKGMADGGRRNRALDFKKRTMNIFKQIFEFWSSNYKDIYSLFIVEEQLTTLLKQFLLSSKQKLDKQKCEYICKRLWYDVEDILYKNQKSKIGYFYNFMFDIIFLRFIEHKINEDREEIPAYSFRNKHLFQAGNLDNKVKKQINKNGTVKPSIFSQLYQFAKKEKLDVLTKVIENGKCYDFNKWKMDDYKNFINKSINPCIKQKRINNLKKYELIQILGEGSFGKVFQAGINDESYNTSLALKQISDDSLKGISSIIIESQFHLFFTNEKIPLLKLEDIFLQKSETSFMLNIVMQQGICALDTSLEEKMKGLSFLDLYKIFKDVLIGITYMNSHFLTHGDIKPANILNLNDNYCLCDYGTGMNLYYESREANNDFFQIGQWFCNGTPNYCDPKIKFEMNKTLNDPEYEPEKVYYDLFKNDIYQTGVTIYEIATGKSVAGIKNQNFNQQICYAEVHKLRMPIQMKNLILHMIQPTESKRINVYALHQCFMDVTQKIVNSTQLTILQSLVVDKQIFYENILKIYYSSHDWFIKWHSLARSQYEKIKNQTTKDQSYFSGQQKPDYNIASVRKQTFQKHQILLLMPNYILCAYQQPISNDENKVMLNNKYIIIKNKDLLLVQFQYYKNSEHLEFYNVDTNSWIPCQIENVNQSSYGVSIKDCQVLNLPINTLKLRQCICLKCILCKQEKTSSGYQKVNREEKQLLSCHNSIFNTCQIFNAYDADLHQNEQPLAVYSNLAKELKRNSLLNGTTSFYCNNPNDEVKNKMNNLLKKGLVRMFCANQLKLKDNHIDAFQSGTLKLLSLCQCEISPDQLVNLFDIFTFTKLHRFKLVNSRHQPIIFNGTSQEYLQKLKDSFAKFANSQQQLYYLQFNLWFEGNDSLLALKQFESLSTLINNFGYRFRKGHFKIRFKLEEEHVEAIEVMTNSIRGSMNQYYNDWKCQVGTYKKRLKQLVISNEQYN